MDRRNPMNRYVRQVMLPEVGTAGQLRLAESRVLVVGAGGLGSAVLPYLAGAGVGNLILVDPDFVELSNLHRQPLFKEADVGRLKVEAAADSLRTYNGSVRVEIVPNQLDPLSAKQLLGQADVALDCADSFAVTYMLSDACFEQGLPLISASAVGFAGYAGGFCGGAPSVRAVFPSLPDQGINCADAGVLGPVVGMIGCFQAHMALAVSLDLEPSPLGKLMRFDGRELRFSEFRFGSAPEPTEKQFQFISPETVERNDTVVDLRGRDEAPELMVPGAIRSTLDKVEQLETSLEPSKRLVLCCRTGFRAWKAAERLRPNWSGEIALVAVGQETNERNTA